MKCTVIRDISSAISSFLFFNHLTDLHWEHWDWEWDHAGLDIQITKSHKNQTSALSEVMKYKT